MLSDFKMTSESKAKRLPKYEFGNCTHYKSVNLIIVSKQLVHGMILLQGGNCVSCCAKHRGQSFQCCCYC